MMEKILCQQQQAPLNRNTQKAHIKKLDTSPCAWSPFSGIFAFYSPPPCWHKEESLKTSVAGAARLLLYALREVWICVHVYPIRNNVNFPYPPASPPPKKTSTFTRLYERAVCVGLEHAVHVCSHFYIRKYVYYHLNYNPITEQNSILANAPNEFRGGLEIYYIWTSAIWVRYALSKQNRWAAVILCWNFLKRTCTWTSIVGTYAQRTVCERFPSFVGKREREIESW